MFLNLSSRFTYPIGEFSDGFRLCVSVSEDGTVDWFSEHRDFDLSVMDAVDEAPFVRDEDVRSWPGEIPDDAPTLSNPGGPEGVMDLDWD